VDELDIIEIQAKADRMAKLMESPAWLDINSALLDSLAAYDSKLHSHCCGDAVGMQMLQTTCKVIRDMIETPARIYNTYMEILNPKKPEEEEE
jgi:hypothetical protein